MSDKHTPGPWTIDNDHRPGMEYNRHILQRDDPNMRIAFMAHDNGRNPKKDLANARLIAAAPDMLRALETIALHAPSLDADGVRELCDAAIHLAKTGRLS